MRKFRSAIRFLVLFLFWTVVSVQKLDAQNSGPDQTAAPGIADNSFLIEEAYNQENRVVQHISTFNYSRSPQKNWIYTFTQEWPFLGQAHQLSYTIPYQSMDSGITRGIGDFMVNYRYQMSGESEGDWAWITPRLSLILPTGDRNKGLGSGSVGAQAAIALSKEVSGPIVVHGNVGCTMVFSSGTLVSYYGGGSVIWQTTRAMNFMLEYLAASNAAADAIGSISRSVNVMLNPGIRFALNLPHLQVVPGIAFPVTFADGGTNSGIYIYLSFEHPY